MSSPKILMPVSSSNGMFCPFSCHHYIYVVRRRKTKIINSYQMLLTPSTDLLWIAWRIRVRQRSKSWIWNAMPSSVSLSGILISYICKILLMTTLSLMVAGLFWVLMNLGNESRRTGSPMDSSVGSRQFREISFGNRLSEVVIGRDTSQAIGNSLGIVTVCKNDSFIWLNYIWLAIYSLFMKYKTLFQTGQEFVDACNKRARLDDHVDYSHRPD